MRPRGSALPLLLLVGTWLLAAAGMVLVASVNDIRPGWDMHVYGNALRSVAQHHDPYADGIAVQQATEAFTSTHPDAMPPFTYVYSPITLPLLRLLAPVPHSFLRPAYWILFFLAEIVTVLALLRLCVAPRAVADHHLSASPRDFEPTLFAFLGPTAIFFPGLLYLSVALSGNLAYLLYALMFAAAVPGFLRNRWLPFYLAVLVAACFKAPMLTFLVVPVFSAKKQWIPAGITAAAGLALFALPSRIMPAQFQHYLQAVSLQFSLNHDFGHSLASIVANFLYWRHLPYTFASAVAYAATAIAVLFVLFRLSRRYLRGEISLAGWAPVLLCGVILLNPRIKEYDVAAISLPMAILLWRLISRGVSSARGGFEALMLFLLLNAAGSSSAEAWKPTECFILLALFAVGAWDLGRRAETVTSRPPSGITQGRPLAA